MRMTVTPTSTSSLIVCASGAGEWKTNLVHADRHRPDHHLLERLVHFLVVGRADVDQLPLEVVLELLRDRADATRVRRAARARASQDAERWALARAREATTHFSRSSSRKP